MLFLLTYLNSVWYNHTIVGDMYTLDSQFLAIDTASRKPIYEQLADGLKALIARGDLREGVTLPPVRQLAADLGVNLNTVAVAYRQLQDEGLITVRHGSGAVVSSRVTATQTEEDLRKPLRSALTQLVLSGMPTTRIMRMVTAELRFLTNGAK